jgi:hypothetical protein
VKRIFAILAGGLAFVALSAAAVPNPVVSGPIASTVVPGDPSRNYQFFSTNHPLAVNGYIEEEYFIEGTANQYNTPTGATGSVIGSPRPYRTRVVVRRPASDKKFNGTVLVEWINVSNGFDAENLWFFSWEHILRSGYAWVGVSAQRVGVSALAAWNPSRYGALDVTSGGTITNDALSYDIFMQAGQALRHPGAVDMLGGLKAKAFIATGESQSAQRLSIFVNSIMPLGNVYDGAFLLSNYGQPIRPDPVVPVWKTLFEWDLQTGEAAIRMPDSAVFRTWEVAGTAHVDHHLRLSREPLELRDIGTSSEAALAPNCAVPSIGSQVPNHYVVDAALDHMARWVTKGTPPPTAPRMQIASFQGNRATIARNEFNLALGGIRLSEIEVPTAENVGQNDPLTPSAGACLRWGYHLPFSLATLDTLYPNRGTYRNQVIRVTKDNVRNGYLLPEDGQRTIDEAMSSSVGAP